MGTHFPSNKLYKNRASRWLWAKSATILLLLTSGVRAQSALDGFDPNANGLVRVVVVQPDGKILIGGLFSTVSGVPRNGIARLNADGSLDPVFNPSANDQVFAIAVQPDGKILVGGQFNAIGGQPRNHLARLDGTTGLADSFDPNANGAVLAVAAQPDGKIVAGGAFSGPNSIGGQTRNHLARLDPISGLADSFDPDVNGTVFSIAMQMDGKILAGGSFTAASGQTRNNIARFDATTGLADSFDPNANLMVFSLAVQADGKILAGGVFTVLGGQPRNRMARLSRDGTLDIRFNPNAGDGSVLSMVVQEDGKILAGGYFTSMGGQTRNGIARLDAVTGLPDSFDPNANSNVASIAVQQDGKILLGGSFTTLAPNGGTAVTRNHIARLEIDGRLDQTLNFTSVGNWVIATTVQPDGKILIGGLFTSILNVPRNNIARLNTDGTLDMEFNPNADGAVGVIFVQTNGKILVGGAFKTIGGQERSRIARLDSATGLADSFDPSANDNVLSIAVDSDGKIIAGGIFNSIGGQSRSHIARLDPTTGLADSFDPNATSIFSNPYAVFSVAVQTDGKILAGGSFWGIGGQTRHHIARLDPATGLADSFDPDANATVVSIVLQTDGKILVGGDFYGWNSIGGQTRYRIARLDPTTGLADSFDPNSTGDVWSMAVQANGKIVVGGNFTSIGGQMRRCIARLDGTTGLADSFDPNASWVVCSVALLTDGKVLVGGEFASINGQARNHFARLTNDTVAFQDLAVAQTAITWSRGGSSLQFNRATFDYSTDNLSYTSLGNATPIGNDWVLQSLNLPTGQNFYIRARGYYRCGYLVGSESVMESVHNVFLDVPTPTPTPSPSTTPTINISGTLSYCSESVPGPVPNVTLTLTGDINQTTLSDSSGNYAFASLPYGGSYSVTPTKSGLTPGTTGIDTVDVVATQRHFLIIGTPLSGCRLTAADVNVDNSVNTIDVVAIQRFFLVLSTGTANVGKYLFTPASRSYQAIVTDQTAQNYDTIVLGDVASPFVE